ncbi:MAG: LysR substrate-binding domain-containing protein [Flavobacteriia bacterium]|nr:LysR substrate-binding domain-containing protein [Flavobacteriia bacterium]
MKRVPLNLDPQIELRQLRYFLELANQLHFRKAAASLLISQPALSRQIKQLEILVGVLLFERDSRKVQLTEAGRFYQSEVTLILQEIDKSHRLLKQLAAGVRAEIKVGFLGSAMQTVIPEMLLELESGFPEIKTSLEELSNIAQIEGVLSQRLDLGFVRLTQVSEHLGMYPLHQDSFSLVVPQDHFLNESNFHSLAQCKDQPFILFDASYSPQYYANIMSLFEEAGFIPKTSHKSVHAQTIFTLVAKGLGLAIVPTALQKGFQMKLRFISLEHMKQRAVLSLIWNKKSRNKGLSHCLDVLNVPVAIR